MRWWWIFQKFPLRRLQHHLRTKIASGGDIVMLKSHTSRQVMLFRLLKQQLLGRQFHSKEEVEMAVCEYLQMQEPD
jgi:hypothetical protein